MITPLLTIGKYVSEKTTRSLDWLEHLFPGNFALVMATGILSLAFEMQGQLILAQWLYAGAVLAWLILIFLSCWRLIRFPSAVVADLLNIRRVFAFFTLVASTSIVGMLLNQHGHIYLSGFFWVLAFLAWSLLLYLSFSVLVFITHPDTVNVVHGDWLTAIIGTQSLVLLGGLIAPYMGEYADYMWVEIHLLWMLGLILYAMFTTMFCLKIFFERFEAKDTSPLLWVIMGAAAIAVNAGTTLLDADIELTFLLTLRPFIEGLVMMLWSWATWWLPMLVIFGIWKHIIRHYPLRYEPALWSMVFPLGMYSVASYRLGLAAEFPPLQWISSLVVWIAFGVWCLVILGLFHSLVSGYRNIRAQNKQ